MGFWSSLTGEDAAEASRAAAADTYQKQQEAAEGLTKFGDQYAGNFRELYQPYANTGATANSALQRLIADPSSVRSLPGYQFAQQEGVQALDRSANARHMGQSGRQSKDLLRFGTGLADQTYGNQLARLMGGTALGMQGNAGIGQGLQGQLGTRQSAYNGAMQSAGTIGQGNIAAANAEAAGSQNLLNAGLKLGGMALGGFGGGGLGGLGGLMGGGSSYSKWFS
jgi:hypothetical protein